MTKQSKTAGAKRAKVTIFERGEMISCGCCRGPEDDRCCCHIHQDISMGRPAKKCSLHTDLQAARELLASIAPVTLS
jgi:hypothetical protein